jgi:5-methyltetrahydrofolate--homocysteine methyltransferase
LAEAGVDAIWIETMTDLEEARAAVTGVRKVSDLPILCSLSFGPKGRTMMGLEAKQAAAELWPLGLSAIGANCGEGIDVVDEVLRQMSDTLPGAPLIAKPNAGQPKVVAGSIVYDMEPPDVARRITDFVALGARVVGSCCGSSPDHIAAIRSAVRESLSPATS